MDRYTDPDFNPLGGATSDKRSTYYFAKDKSGNYVIQKYRPSNSTARTYAYQDDVHILYFIVAVSCISCWRRLSIIWDV